jgi:hypothetical protein
MMARDENDRCAGYQGYAIRRGTRVKSGDHGRITVGPVRPFTAEGYMACAADVREWVREREG